MSNRFRTKRIYEEPTPEDGYRILVDRLWPRGVSQLKARIDLWAKDFTQSNDLRKWFHEAPDRREEFAGHGSVSHWVSCQPSAFSQKEAAQIEIVRCRGPHPVRR